MKIYLFALLCFGCCFAEVPDEILREADRVRNPAESYFLDVEVVDNESSASSRYHVAIRGNRESRFETVQPIKDRGRNFLMLDENMWVFIPNLKREVRVSLNQKLSGKASNGDISRMRWSGDYDATIESETDNEWTLLLKANKKGLTYEGIRVVIEKGSYHPLHGEYLTAGGKVLKKVEFTDYRTLAGRVRPNEIVIEDAVHAGDKSRVLIREMVVRDFPASLFKKT